MKTKHFGIALVTACVLGAAAFAQTPDEPTKPESFVLSCIDEPSAPTSMYSSDGKNFTAGGGGSLGTVRVEVAEGKGRVRIPLRVIPWNNRGDKEGWFQLRNLKIERDRISSYFELSWIAEYEVEIDRLSGRMTIPGLFHGPCTPVTGERQF